MDAIKALIPEHVRIVEDAACAAGASYWEKWRRKNIENWFSNKFPECNL
jgi:hypothetical protein